MSSGVEVEASKDDDVIEVNEEPENATEKEVEITQKVVLMSTPPPPFPQRLVKMSKEGKYSRFISMLKNLSINVSLIEILEQMPRYAKFMKDLKKEDPGAFSIRCTIRLLHFAKALCDLGASINLMPLSIYKKLGLRDPKPTAMQLLMAYRNVKKPIGMLQNVLVKVACFIVPTNFVLLHCDIDFEVPIILGRPFLATRCASVDVEKG
ncbi:uncharacterized protein LOC125877455 [Solanum stenotomum]|uniref:uncharacterized protein LOC125877455 n=1 Tax=Solanum stenotomum TaxID=172797 RepID=UPI0020CFF4F6|nr:uncharacterized protein LOC125877455 [Solanum stenotomum]